MILLQMKNKNIAKVVSDAILVLADYTDRIVELYPGLAGKLDYQCMVNHINPLYKYFFNNPKRMPVLIQD